MSIKNVSFSSPVSPSLGASQGQESPEEILADLVGTVAGLQVKVSQFSIQDRERELKMGQEQEAEQEFYFH